MAGEFWEAPGRVLGAIWCVCGHNHCPLPPVLATLKQQHCQASLGESQRGAESLSEAPQERVLSLSNSSTHALLSVIADRLYGVGGETGSWGSGYHCAMGIVG